MVEDKYNHALYSIQALPAPAPVRGSLGIQQESTKKIILPRTWNDVSYYLHLPLDLGRERSLTMYKKLELNSDLGVGLLSPPYEYGKNHSGNPTESHPISGSAHLLCLGGS